MKWFTGVKDAQIDRAVEMIDKMKEELKMVNAKNWELHQEVAKQEREIMDLQLLLTKLLAQKAIEDGTKAVSNPSAL